jgi:hypothetical protein
MPGGSLRRGAQYGDRGVEVGDRAGLLVPLQKGAGKIVQVQRVVR